MSMNTYTKICFLKRFRTTKHRRDCASASSGSCAKHCSAHWTMVWVSFSFQLCLHFPCDGRARALRTSKQSKGDTRQTGKVVTSTSLKQTSREAQLLRQDDILSDRLIVGIRHRYMICTSTPLKLQLSDYKIVSIGYRLVYARYMNTV